MRDYGLNSTASAAGVHLPPIPSRMAECARCERLVASRRQIVAPTACPPLGILAVGEAPGAQEDEAGEGFVGPAGCVLDALLSGLGIERNRDYGVANLVRCRPPGNRKPTRQEIAACLPSLACFLLECRPKILLLVGATATETFMGSGSLFSQIERSRNNPIALAKDAPPSIQPAIRELHRLVGGLLMIPMPHTSGLAWNRRAPDGRLWQEIGAEQAALAVRHFKGQT
ncbi:MAG: uracil-DNA glycosylase [Rhodocyclaceae bacterium]|nr:uracil-DNA glycosylase [Rhodocyclaceae bacterium]